MRLPLDPKLNRDALELLRELQEQRARFLIVGGVAAIAHGVRRNTVDVDIYVDADPDNLQRVSAALRTFGAPSQVASPEALRPSDGEDLSGVSFGLEPARIDIMTRMPGLPFADAYARRDMATAADTIEVPVISKDDLIVVKRAAGRRQDLDDIRALEQPPRTRGRTR